MNRDDFVVRFAGEGGQGLLTSADALIQAATQVGYHIQTFATFPSQIIGGPTFAQARISTSRVLSSGDEVDVLVAFNREAYDNHKDEVREGGVVIYDTKEFDLQGDSNSFGMPFDDLARSTGNARAANMVVVGTIAYLVSFAHSALEAFNVKKFTRGRPGDDKIIEANKKALALGRDEAESSGFSLGELAPPDKPDWDQILVSGNQALALGACAAGLEFFVGYPISPATSLLIWMEQNMPRLGRFAYQASSELEAISAIVGAGYAGKKAMTGTSGPGFSLMSEGLGLAWMAEIPLVVANIQRGGPSTGLPTKTEQSDLFAALTPAHGDIRLPVIAPGTVEECFNAGAAALNWAERYQGPVIVLSEHMLSERQANLPKPDLEAVGVESRLVYSGENGYQRYEGIELSPMPIPGGPGSYVANGSEHDAIGDTTHLPSRHVQMTERRFGKLALLHESDFECENPDAPVAVVPWGGSKGPALEAYGHLIGTGLNLGWMYTMFLHPLPPAMLDRLRSKELVIVPELNYQGQFSALLRSYGVNAESITHYTGLPFKVSDLKREIRERMMSVMREEVMA